MKQVVIARDVYAPDTWTRATVDDVFDYLKTQFDVWPDTARLYHNYVALEHDVTPDSQADLDHVRTLDGVFYVVVYPADPFTLIVIAVSVVVSVAVALLMPLPAIPNLRNQTQGSPNNELSSRANKLRPNGRIPDIFGTVRSTPDLIAVPYSVFENNIEIEHMIGLIGRGTFDIKDAYDGETRIADIQGASVQLYELNEDIDTGTPFKQYGELIDEPPYQVIKSNSVNGQVLRAPNAIDFGGSNDVYFQYPNQICLDSGSSRDFRASFKVGDVIRVRDAPFDWVDSESVSSSLNLNGSYVVDSIAQRTIALSDPAAVNSAWGTLGLPETIDGRTDQRTNLKSPTFSLVDFRWVGDFVVEDPQRTHFILNFVALNGLYAENGSAQYSWRNDFEVEVTPVDLDDEPNGFSETTVFSIEGSSTVKDTIARTIYLFTGFTGRCKIKIRRTNDTDFDFAGTIVDEVKWRDLYSARELERKQYGDVTIARSRTQATSGALSVKERKLNFLVQRKLPTYDAITGTMTTTRTATNSAADAFAAVCLDPFIGRRDVSEVDLAGIYQAIADVAAYFGTASAAEFCYTFDRENQSFEEIATTIAQAVFCEAYRQGNQIKLSFERETDDSVLLFNHRNKVPKSEKRTITFGIENSFDGVEYEWIDPADDTKTVLKIPNDAITNPKKITSVGVRNARQAHFSAWRVWNKLRYQRESVEFEALRESDLLVRKDRILVADNTRTGTQDGEIETQTGLIVTTSQPCTFDPAKSYTMHLQLYDGSVDAIGCTAGADAYSVVLDRAPLLPLVLEHDRYLRTIYMITSNDDVRAKAFLVGEKSNAGRMTNSLKCVNYDSRYYQNDSDFINSLIP
ncbi:MAG: host specificity factor TipJ family phage tail protein [Moraxellaceae bacterium]